MGKWPSGQRQLTVNQPGKPYSGSNPLLPTKKANALLRILSINDKILYAKPKYRAQGEARHA